MQKKIFFFSFIFLIIIFGIILIVNKSTNKTDLTKIQVSTSFYPLYYFASQIGGDKTQVTNITPAGAEPHDYEPTPADLAKIETSKMLILNGGVESWGQKLQEELKGKILVVVAAKGLLTKNLIESGVTAIDPHVWLSPNLAEIEAQNILAGFIQIDPNNKSYYEENEKNLENKLTAVDNQYKDGLKNCQQKNIVTSHAAFAYLSQQYGLNQVAVAGLSPDAEPSSTQIANVADFAKRNNIKYIFFESLISPKLSDTIASEIGAKTLVLDPLEGIPQDKINKGEDYFTIMEKNLTNLKLALTCQ